jgi:hypothetical protein
MVEAGRIAEVAQYCGSDVLNTYRLWLVYELFRANISAEQLAFSETHCPSNGDPLCSLKTACCSATCTAVEGVQFGRRVRGLSKAT